jgi:hypothetical protein
MKLGQMVITGLLMAAAPVLGSDAVAAEEGMDIAVYDEAAYTEYVEATMKKLDRLYLDFCASCGVDATKAGKAKQEFLTTVRDLMQYMNGRFDALDPKAGAALSPTETLVSIHALTMLVDILTAMEIEDMTAHPYID